MSRSTDLSSEEMTPLPSLQPTIPASGGAGLPVSDASTCLASAWSLESVLADRARRQP
jgi:hypothetical protein